jgi:hypothetical protein
MLKVNADNVSMNDTCMQDFDIWKEYTQEFLSTRHPEFSPPSSQKKMK